MLGLILRALATRRAATLTLLVLTVLAAGAAAAAPQYVAASMADLAEARAEAAPVDQRVLNVQTRIPGSQLTADRVDAFAEEVAAALPLPGLTRVTGLQIAGTASGERGSTASGLYYRAGVCDQLTIDGDCPTRPGEALVSVPTAAALGVEVGDEFRYSLPGADPTTLTVAGLYRANDPFADYWAGRRLVGLGSPEDPGTANRATTAGVFTTIETFVAGKPREGAATVEAIAGSGVFAVAPPLDVRDAVGRAQADLLDRGYESQAPLRTFSIGVYNNQIDIVRSVPVSLLELLAICWVALFLAVRHGAQERRRDIGLLKLRGSGRTRMLLLALGQSAVPMLIGGVIGLVAALPLRPASGTVDAATARQADTLSLAAVAVAVLGALIAAAIAERRALTAPVALLMRAVPPRRTGWRYGTIDAVVVALALAGAYEARSFAAADETATWLALLTPALLAVALGVLIARLLVPIAARAGRVALRAGRLGAAVTATELARRPAVPRLTALLTVAVALLCTAAAAADTISRAGDARASNEVGADRVLIVRADSRSRLLSAVREVDPQGRTAMAVVVSPSAAVLAVDASRLAAVARWRGEYGAAEARAVADRLLTRTRDPVTITGRTLTLDAGGGRQQPVVGVTLADREGARVQAVFGPIGGPRRTYTANVPTCAAGCRLVSVGLEPPPEDAGLPTVQIHGIGGVDPAVLTDRTRWRTGFGGGPKPIVVATGPAGLSLTVTEPLMDTTLYLDDAPARLPAIATAPSLPLISAGDPHLQAFPGAAIPVDVVGAAAALPRLGNSGALVDLAAADLMWPDFGGGDSLQVWLTADAPADLPDRLAAHGVETVSSTTSDGIADRYGRQAVPVTVRFQLVAAAVAVLLAAGALGVVVAVERRPRTGELMALRRQGLSAATAGRAALGGYVVVVVLAVVAGLLTAIVARTVLAVPTPLFPDDWSVLAAPPGARWLPLAAATGAVLLVYAAVVLAAAGRPRAYREDNP
jgi:putative ABC transport system permease protein